MFGEKQVFGNETSSSKTYKKKAEEKEVNTMVKIIKKSVNMRGTINMTLKLLKIDNKANYRVSWIVDGREMHGRTYHGKKNAMKNFNEIHRFHLAKVKWFDEIK